MSFWWDITNGQTMIRTDVFSASCGGSYVAPTELWTKGGMLSPARRAPKGALARGYDYRAATRLTGAYGAHGSGKTSVRIIVCPFVIKTRS